MMGARQYGGPDQKAKCAVILVPQRYVMPKFLSDLAGNDPAAHHNEPREVVRIIRNHLRTDPAGKRLPGAAHMADLLDEFRDDLPKLALAAQLTLGEVNAYRGYHDFMTLMREFRDAIFGIAD